MMVSFEILIEDGTRSDKNQVENALKSGGQIRIEDTNNGYYYAFRSDYNMYGAVDASNMLHKRSRIELQSQQRMGISTSSNNSPGDNILF